MMEMMVMEMVMTFSDFDAYQLKLLFRSWDIQTKTQFALSWFAVMFAVIFFHFMKYCYRKLSAMLEESDVPTNQTTPLLTAKKDSDTKSKYDYRHLLVARAALNALIYGWALMLMLVSMTYNSSLFCALVIGYFFGDLIFQELPQRGARTDIYLTNDCESCH